MNNPIFDLLFPVEGVSPVSDKNTRHCMCNALAHMKGIALTGYTSTIYKIDPDTQKFGLVKEYVRVYTPSMEDGVITDFDCKVS